ncbi:hypothetical protein Tsubulata_017074 [Turnera subulata]|uniref:DUF7699 domain-containing protein n=1 Tax=Turnera subulata TaxID=218843 RepID=A0A9Q0GEB0_9ROSI|nr:hypothetical protein Tsubulata_017074 [Turnera subulata]
MKTADPERKRKRPVVCLSSSSASSESEEEDEDEEDSDYDDETGSISGDDSDYSEDAEESEPTDDANDSDGDDGRQREEEDKDGEVDEESLCNRVIRLLEGFNPISLQKSDSVFYRFNKVTRRGKLLGRRSVAGRVVKESYGSAKQQHTFTYSYFSFLSATQPWNDEAERVKVLAEKHKRGATARHIRAMKKSQKMKTTNGGVKQCRRSHYTRPSPLKRTGELKRRNHASDCGRGTSQQLHFKRNARPGGSRTAWRNDRLNCSGVDMGPVVQQHAFAIPGHNLQQAEQWRTMPFHFSGNERGFTSMMRTRPHFKSSDTNAMPPSQNQELNHSNYTRYHCSSPDFEMRNLNHLADLTFVDRPVHQFHQGWGHNGQGTSRPSRQFSRGPRHDGPRMSGFR